MWCFTITSTVPAPKSGRGQPHSKTLARPPTPWKSRGVLECGCPLPLWLAAVAKVHVIRRHHTRGCAEGGLARELRTMRLKRFMATKVKMLKLLQEGRSFAEFSNRRPPPRTPGLFVMQLRGQGFHDSLRRRKLSIAIDTATHTETPHRVRINHLKSKPDAGVRAPGP